MIFVQHKQGSCTLYVGTNKHKWGQTRVHRAKSEVRSEYKMRIQKEKKSDLALFRMQGDCDNRKRCTAPTNGESFYYLETAPLARSKTNTKIQKQNTDTKWNTERYKYYYGKFLFIWRLPPWHAPRQTHGGKIQNINTKWNTNTKWKTNTNTNMKWNAKNKIIQMRKVSI